MPTLAQVRNRCDAFLADRVLPRLQLRQEAFFANRGRYWRGTFTHAEPPNHTDAQDGDAVPDRFDDSGPGETTKWADVWPALASTAILFQLAIDRYEGPHGNGWVAVVRVRYNGEVYQRSFQQGPEARFTKAWSRE